MVPFAAETFVRWVLWLTTSRKQLNFIKRPLALTPSRFSKPIIPDVTYYGEKAGYRGKRAFAKMGPMMIELTELIEGKTLHEQFLKERGEGLHHLGFEVQDLKESVARAERPGFKVTQSWQREDGLGFAYLDSDKIGGVIFEMIQWSKE